MSLRSLKQNLKNKSEIKEDYLNNIRVVSTDLSEDVEDPMRRILNAALENLEADEYDIVKNTPGNRRITAETSERVKREMRRHQRNIDKSLTATGVVATDVYQALKREDAEYLGGGRNAAFVSLNDEVIEDSARLHKEAIEQNRVKNADATRYIINNIKTGLLFNLTRNALRGKLFSATNHVSTSAAGGTIFSNALNSMNSHGGGILNFYSEVGVTQQEGIRQVYNSNPMDDRTKPLCAAATFAGVISIREMEDAYGVPPRMLCRCDLIYLNPKWKDVKEDVNKLIAEQKENWRKILRDAPRRRNGQFYASVEEQLNVLSGKLTPAKFKATSLHSAKMRILSRPEFNDLLRKYKSSYSMRYSVPVKGFTPPISKKPPVTLTEKRLHRISLAEARIKQTGIRNVDFNELADPLLADQIAEAMEDLSRQGYATPRNLYIRSINTDDYLRKKKLVQAYYNRIDDTIVINKNPKTKWWAQKSRKKYSQTKNRWHSSNSPKATIYHEVGHKNHLERIGLDKYGQAIKTKITPAYMDDLINDVGEYATTNGAEFVAEVFAGKMSGIVYNKDVLDLYKKLGGF